MAKNETKDKKATKTAEVHRTIKEEYSDAEITKKARQLSKAMREREEIKADAKAEADKFKEQVTAKETEIDHLAKAIDNGFEMVSRPCKMTLNFDEGIREYWFGGKVVDTEPLTAKDHQLEIDEAEDQNKEVANAPGPEII